MMHKKVFIAHLLIAAFASLKYISVIAFHE